MLYGGRRPADHIRLDARPGQQCVDQGTLATADLAKQRQVDDFQLATPCQFLQCMQQVVLARRRAYTGSVEFDGARLADKLRDEPSTYLGTMVNGYPNLVMIAGPRSGSASTNFPRAMAEASGSEHVRGMYQAVL